MEISVEHGAWSMETSIVGAIAQVMRFAISYGRRDIERQGGPSRKRPNAA
jgi:hypothetical protein